MAFDTYMTFTDSNGAPTPGESQMQFDSNAESPLGKDLQPGKVFEIDDFSFDIEQVLNIGSQSSGAGAGKVTFNPFQVTRKSDRLSPKLFTMCCAGQHFNVVSLYLRRAGGSAGGVNATSNQTSGTTFLRFDFALVAVKTISWSGSDGDEACKEEVQFEYGALQVRYVQQGADGKVMSGGDSQPVGSWNRVWNNNQFNLAQFTSQSIKAT
jgi:type VI secretion system secreted protein Hcp